MDYKFTPEEVFINSDDILELQDYKYPEIPEEQHCKFCNKKLAWRGVLNPLEKKSVLNWISIMDCDCKEFQEEKQRLKEKEEKAKLEKEEFERKQAELEKIRLLFKNSNVSKRGLKRTFESFEVNNINGRAYEIARKYAEDWDKFKEDGTGLIFIGKFGTGKTHLAFAIANYLLNNGVPVIFETLINLMEKLKLSYGRTESLDYYDIIKLYCECDLLIIDDLGKEKLSEWVLEKLFQIINSRYENMLPIIITTNYNEEQIINRLSSNNDGVAAKSLVSRLNEICLEVDMNFGDYRKK